MGWLRKGAPNLANKHPTTTSTPTSQLHQFTGNDPTNGKDSDPLTVCPAIFSLPWISYMIRVLNHSTNKHLKFT